MNQTIALALSSSGLLVSVPGLVCNVNPIAKLVATVNLEEILP